jgi:hypothetical protein
MSVVRGHQPVQVPAAGRQRPARVAQELTAVGAIPGGSILAFRSPMPAAALGADSWGGSRCVYSRSRLVRRAPATIAEDASGGLLTGMHGCYPGRVSPARLSEGTERYPRSCASPPSRFPENSRVIVNAQSRKRPRALGMPHER